MADTHKFHLPEKKGKDGKAATPVKRPKRVLFVFMCILAALVATVTLAVGIFVSPYFDIAVTFTSKPDTSSEAVTQASDTTRDVTQEVESEGIILLKNQNNSLPLDGTQKVNVFGSTAGNNFSYGGTGSGSGDMAARMSLRTFSGMEPPSYTGR